jgi:hypothetical protein
MANYDIAKHWGTLSPGQRDQVINLATIKQIKEWANDPDCNQMLLCKVALAEYNTALRTEQVAGFKRINEVPTELKLKQELKSLSVMDLVFFMWKFWWAALLAGLIPAFVVFVLALFIKSISDLH